MPREMRITDAKRGAAFTVRIVTRAQRDELVGIQEDGSVKVRLTASPAEGQAKSGAGQIPGGAARRAGKSRGDRGRAPAPRQGRVGGRHLDLDEAEARLQPDPGAGDET